LLTSPLLWYIGSAIGPARSKICAAGNPASWNGWWSEQHALVEPTVSSGAYRPASFVSSCVTSAEPSPGMPSCGDSPAAGRQRARRRGERAARTRAVREHVRLDHEHEVLAGVLGLARVRAAAEEPLLLARERREDDVLLERDAGGADRAREREERGRARAVVVAAGRAERAERAARVVVRGEQHGLVRRARRGEPAARA
jgi:hypothetical protein